MSQRLGEWWRETQARVDLATVPAWRRALYAALQATVRPVQAGPVWWQARTPPEDSKALRAAYRAWKACRRG